MTSTETRASRFDRLAGFLAQDPANAVLAADVAQAGLDEGRLSELRVCLEPHLHLVSTPAPTLVNLLGIASLKIGDFQDAAMQFEQLLAIVDSPEVRFNLAWACSRLGRQEEALDLLDEAVVASAPRAASLRVEMLHHLGRMEEALAWGRTASVSRPDDESLWGALATVALDEELPDEAAEFAGRAASTPEARAVFGMLALNQGRLPEAIAHFDQALAEQPRNARAKLGKGLALLSAGQTEAGLEPVEEAAALFGDHLGSWVAAGWARYANGDHRAARQHFEHALSIDENFGEAHGGLAVLDLTAGDLPSAERRTAIALRLDRNSLGAALAKSMMADQTGAARAASRIREAVFQRPLAGDGRSLGEMMRVFNGSSHLLRHDINSAADS